MSEVKTTRDGKVFRRITIVDKSGSDLIAATLFGATMVSQLNMIKVGQKVGLVNVITNLWEGKVTLTSTDESKIQVILC